MKQLPWILAGGALAAAVYLLVNGITAPQYATGADSVEDAAHKTFGWGSKQRATGLGTNVVGKVKEGFGRVTGDQDLADEGVADQAIGTIKDAAGQLAHAAGETLHDLNR
ncbi:Uncharacterized conserved protein YjbJ, UPF0337 family [Granulicella rosea]|uniref:Uncharacterized conserved protein YjbJ, UPF0337 family n=1 Tax=Granulicella rosea TaxID=474952 RepID=A0A239D2U0_9BACT|nr:CsbD family protein [Granulicella rosea]SNS25913.1 Uncharacterized conserved protein YjbJ, UPF0337 family [Granulicella rosea]